MPLVDYSNRVKAGRKRRNINAVIADMIAGRLQHKPSMCVIHIHLKLTLHYRFLKTDMDPVPGWIGMYAE